MKKHNKAMLAKVIAVLLAITALAPAVYAADKAPGKVIGVQAAEEAAFNDAGVKKEDVSNIRTNLELDDGRYIYDVEFLVGNVEYDYEILAENGDILEKDKEVRKHLAGNDNSAAKATSSDKAADKKTDKYIGVEKARKIALEHAGLKADEVTYMKVDLDKHERIPEYEIEFFYGGMEYEYDIDAVHGKVLEFSSEIDD